MPGITAAIAVMLPVLLATDPPPTHAHPALLLSTFLKIQLEATVSLPALLKGTFKSALIANPVIQHAALAMESEPISALTVQPITTNQVDTVDTSAPMEPILTPQLGNA